MAGNNDEYIIFAQSGDEEHFNDYLDLCLYRKEGDYRVSYWRSGDYYKLRICLREDFERTGIELSQAAKDTINNFKKN
jgi:hypothetical protein